MKNSEFVYTTYIRTTPEKIWNAITNPEFTRQYWGEYANISDWKKGSQWQHVSNDGQKGVIRICGEVLESNPPKRLVLSWVGLAEKQDKSKYSRVTFEIERIEDMVCLNVIHDKLIDGSEMAGKIAIGWPRVLSSMKSFLETGKAIDIMAVFKKNCGSVEEAKS